MVPGQLLSETLGYACNAPAPAPATPRPPAPEAASPPKVGTPTSPADPDGAQLCAAAQPSESEAPHVVPKEPEASSPPLRAATSIDQVDVAALPSPSLADFTVDEREDSIERAMRQYQLPEQPAQGAGLPSVGTEAAASTSASSASASALDQAVSIPAWVHPSLHARYREMTPEERARNLQPLPDDSDGSDMN
eukprot:164515-Alexandrium_andersonii.AAC.1